MKPLNPGLHDRLLKVFGHVRVANQGQPMRAMHLPDRSQQRARLRLIISEWGETYAVNCPFCTDTRRRLTINHRWAVRDPKTGDDMLHLCHCHNEDCTNNRTNQKRLHAMVFPDGRFADEVDDVPSLSAFGNVVAPARKIKPPGPVFPLQRLPPEHPANLYLAGRFFDPERLGRFYRVGYCVQSSYFLARNRIIVPVYQHGKLEGWQARFIGDMDWKAPDAPPKWWTCPNMHKSKLLYNLDNARLWKTGVVVEGAGDVWGFGPMAVATFGSSMSGAQQAALFAAFGTGSLVMLWDPDVQADPKKKLHYDGVLHGLRQAGFRHGVASVILPDGTDPGSLDRGFLRDYVAREAKGQGVKVTWAVQASEASTAGGGDNAVADSRSGKRCRSS